MIEVQQLNETYHLGREKPGGKVYVLAANESQIASYSGLTKIVEWYQKVSLEEAELIETYLREHY